MELVVAALIHDVQALFSMNETTPKSPASPSPKMQGLSMQEAQRKFNVLAATLPALCDADNLFRTLEIPPLAQRAIRSFYAASKQPSGPYQNSTEVVKVRVRTLGSDKII